MEEIYFSQYANNPTEKTINKYLMKNPNIETGTYIDIGACHPIKISNTYWYYTKGWNGLLIEPFAGYHKSIQALRPRDILEPVAITDYNGEIEMCCTTTVGSEAGDRFKADPNYQYGLYTAKCMTIDSLIEKYPQFKEPDFLNIDIESNEEKALSKCNFAIFKPKVICIEFLCGKHDYHKILEPYLLPYYEFKEDVTSDAFYVRKELK